MKILSDTDSERAILAGLIKFGSIIYHEISTIGLTDATFTIDSHRVIYRCLDKIFKSNENVKPDIPLIYSAAADIGVKYFFQKDEEIQYLASIMELPVKQQNLIVFARKIKKLEVAKNACTRIDEAKNDLTQITGNESINDIFGIIEESIIDCASFLSVEEMAVTLLSEGIDEHFKTLEENPIQQVGISTGFPIYDAAIGGGLRPGSVNVIAARPKIGKSTLSINISSHIANLDIPVLYLDTEMSKTDSWNRIIASTSYIDNKEVETGKYTAFLKNKNKVHTAIEKVKKLPIYYSSIADQSLENQISIIKRWLITTVGLTPDGKAKPCVLIYDYLKIMTQDEIKNVQEHQAVGFLVSSLINFAKRYDIPILTFVQMNRDGIQREDTGTISLSDRILWFCSSLAIFKAKTSDEMDKDGYENGNRKLKPLECRYGPGMADMDYINCNFNKSISRITEGKTRFELDNERKRNEKLSEQPIESNDKVSF